MFTDTGLTAHFYLFIAGVVVIILFFGYAFWYDHKKQFEDHNIDKIFKRYGLSEEQISNISHDDDMWYYKRKSTCVGYSSIPDELCPKFQEVCVGGKTFGNLEDQIREVVKAIKIGGLHEDCPLIYEGAN
jgi:hypothetical protein